MAWLGGRCLVVCARVTRVCRNDRQPKAFTGTVAMSSISWRGSLGFCPEVVTGGAAARDSARTSTGEILAHSRQFSVPAKFEIVV